MPGRKLSGFAAAIWCGLFGVMHVYWALGGRAGLPPDVGLLSDPRLLAADLVAIPICFVFALLLMRIARHCGPVGWPWLATLTAASAFCLLHSLPPLVGALLHHVLEPAAPALSDREAYALLVYEPYWLAGGLLMLATALSCLREPRGPGRT